LHHINGKHDRLFFGNYYFEFWGKHFYFMKLKMSLSKAKIMREYVFLIQ
jgi:hypothetical protein